MNLPRLTKGRRNRPRSASRAKVRASGAKAGTAPVETSPAAGRAEALLAAVARLALVVHPRADLLGGLRVEHPADLKAPRRTTAAARLRVDQVEIQAPGHAVVADGHKVVRPRVVLRDRVDPLRVEIQETAIVVRLRGPADLLRVDLKATRKTGTVVRLRAVLRGPAVRRRAALVALPKVDIKVLLRDLGRVPAVRGLVAGHLGDMDRGVGEAGAVG